MADYDNTNKGVLYDNENSWKANAPDRTGNIHPKCPHCGVTTEYWLSAWWKNTRVGKVLSLAMNPKEPTAPVVTPKTPKEPQSFPPLDDFDDDIPF